MVIKIYGPVKEGECWIIETNKDINNILQRKNTLKFIKSFRPRQCVHIEKMQNKKVQKQTATTAREGRGKRGRPCKR